MEAHQVIFAILISTVFPIALSALIYLFLEKKQVNHIRKKFSLAPIRDLDRYFITASFSYVLYITTLLAKDYHIALYTNDVELLMAAGGNYAPGLYMAIILLNGWGLLRWKHLARKVERSEFTEIVSVLDKIRKPQGK